MSRRKYDNKQLTSAEEFNRLVASISYAERIKTVRAYYPDLFTAKKGFHLNKPLTGKQKYKVTRYYKAIRPFLSAPIVKQKLKNVEQASAAWRWLHGIEPPLGTLYIAIHESPKNKPKLKFEKIEPEPLLDEYDNEILDKKGKPVMSLPDVRVSVKLGRGLQAENYYFDDYALTPELIARDPDALLADMLERIGAPRYAIMTGDHLFSHFASKRRGSKDELRDNTVYMGGAREVIETIRKLQNMYNDKTKNNYWGNWLMGVKAYFFEQDNQAEFEKYRKKVKEAKLERVEIWREVRKLNRTIRTANDQIKNSEAEIKAVRSEKGARDRLLFSPGSRRGKIKNETRFKERAQLNLDKAMRQRAKLIMSLTNKL